MNKADLIEAVHLIRHEHGDLWPPTDGCGCLEWATALTNALDDVRKRRVNAAVESDRDPGDHFAYPQPADVCDDCHLPGGAHNIDVEH